MSASTPRIHIQGTNSGAAVINGVEHLIFGDAEYINKTILQIKKNDKEKEAK